MLDLSKFLGMSMTVLNSQRLDLFDVATMVLEWPLVELIGGEDSIGFNVLLSRPVHTNVKLEVHPNSPSLPRN